MADNNSESNPDYSSYDYMEYGTYKAGETIWKVVPPILIFLGTFGNCLSIYVLTRKSIRTSTTAFYLTFLAFSDLVVLYSGLLRQWLIYLFETDVRSLSPAGCKINIWLVYCSLDLSAWILIVVTLERVISAWLPHSARVFCSRKVAMVFMIGIIVFILALNAHLLYGMDFVETFDASTNTTAVSKCVYIDHNYFEFFEKPWAWVDLAVYCAIPFTVIVIGNSLILFKVLQSQKRSKTLVVPATAVNSQPVRQRATGNRNSSMTAMLFTLNVVFLLTTSPVSIYNIGYPYWVEDATDEEYANLEFWWAATSMLMYANNSINFFLYCLSGTKFRREVIKLFRFNWCKSTKNANDSDAAQSKYSRTRFDPTSRQNPDIDGDDSARNSPKLGVSGEHSTVSSILPARPGNDSPLSLKSNTLHPDTALHIEQNDQNDPMSNI